MPKEKKTARIDIMIEPSKKAALIEKANKANQTLSEYILSKAKRD